MVSVQDRHVVAAINRPNDYIRLASAHAHKEKYARELPEGPWVV